MSNIVLTAMAESYAKEQMSVLLEESSNLTAKGKIERIREEIFFAFFAGYNMAKLATMKNEIEGLCEVMDDAKEHQKRRNKRTKQKSKKA